jgi:hypothetical protein
MSFAGRCRGLGNAELSNTDLKRLGRSPLTAEVLTRGLGCDQPRLNRTNWSIYIHSLNLPLLKVGREPDARSLGLQFTPTPIHDGGTKPVQHRQGRFVDINTRGEVA